MKEIFGIGIDQIQVSRVEKACEKISFIEKYYSEKERKLIQNRSSLAATNFAGKEAVVKAFGTGFSEGITPAAVQILRRENGAPYVELTDGALKWAKLHKIEEIHISLTDTKEYASAFTVAVTEIEL